MDNQKNWYQSFFHGVALELWQKAVSQSLTDTEISFIHSLVPLSEGARILDVPCGFGRHSLALAQQGFQLTSVDISAPYLEQLIQVKDRLNLPIQTLYGDILDLELSGSYDLAICLGNSFNYFPYEGMRRWVQKIGAALQPDGALIINTGCLAESLLPNLEKHPWMEVDDILFLMDNQYLADESVLRTHMTYVKQGQVEKGTAFHYVYTLAEIRRLLMEAGFRKVTAYSGTDQKPFQLADKQAYIFARK